MDEIVYACKSNDLVFVERLLNRFSIKISKQKIGLELIYQVEYCFWVAAGMGRIVIINRIFQNIYFDPSSIYKSGVIEMATSNGHIDIVNRLLLDPCFDSCYVTSNEIIRSAVNTGDLNMVNHLLVNPRIDPSDFFFSEIAMIRSRSGEIFIGLQDLGLPALITLEILDALFHNGITMFKKWALIVTVKHFHDRRRVG